MNLSLRFIIYLFLVYRIFIAIAVEFPWGVFGCHFRKDLCETYQVIWLAYLCRVIYVCFLPTVLSSIQFAVHCVTSVLETLLMNILR